MPGPRPGLVGHRVARRAGQRVVPAAPTRPQGGGRRRHGNQEALAAIVFVATSGGHLGPAAAVCFGPSGPTAHRRFAERAAARVWAKLYQLPGELGSRGELDWSRCAVDSVNCGPRKGTRDGPNPVDRGTSGSKIHVLTERTALPVSLAISGANLHDSQSLVPLVEAIPPICSRCGPRRRRPATLRGGKAYGHRVIRSYLRRRQITHRITRRGIESSPRLGRHRWAIERTVARLGGFRRLHRRHERKADHLAAFATVAAALICHRRPVT
ncbi:IS5 family transposase [Kitasatospora sp. NPDC085895]|uniref:IS5 family transposase n=1 Tax=Kitasatospora sp. NPDC085895 TaxID=3155057 RepID=UPI00344D41B3